MTLVHRVLTPNPYESLDAYVQHFKGGTGLQAARDRSPDEVIGVVEAAGLRGRGGAGFPTARKWRAVQENSSPDFPSTVVVNGAEGEPGTFKDRTILLRNPYLMLEGALIAAYAVGAPEVIVGLKRSFGPVVARVRSAIAELEAAGWADGVTISIFEGPDEYLYGEETALLETIDGRFPFPRIAPPFREGLFRLLRTDDDLTSGSGLSADVELAGPGDDTPAPPALVDNVETLANLPRILERGSDWFRTEGTPQSPGTVVCTITGRVANPGVGEVLMGTTLREAIDEISGGPLPGHRITAVVPGVSSPVIPASQLDVPLTYEAMAAIGSGLGSGGFWVLDETVDPVAAVAGVVRFLAVESCGQCSPCKQDGLALADALERVARSEARSDDLAVIRKRVNTVANGARCSIGTQQQVVVTGLLDVFGAEVDAHLSRAAAPAAPAVVAELLDIGHEGVVVDVRHASKQPDWTYEPSWRGETPVERFTDHRSHSALDS